MSKRKPVAYEPFDDLWVIKTKVNTVQSQIRNVWLSATAIKMFSGHISLLPQNI